MDVGFREAIITKLGLTYWSKVTMALLNSMSDLFDVDYSEINDVTGIGNLTNLSWLYLMNNNLSSVPSEIGDLANLTRLNLNDNNLTSIPLEIGDMINLTMINLNNNDLTSLPTEIWNLDLKTLNLSYNSSFATIPTAPVGNNTRIWRGGTQLDCPTVLASGVEKCD